MQYTICSPANSIHYTLIPSSITLNLENLMQFYHKNSCAFWFYLCFSSFGFNGASILLVGKIHLFFILNHITQYIMANIACADWLLIFFLYEWALGRFLVQLPERVRLDWNSTKVVLVSFSRESAEPRENRFFYINIAFPLDHLCAMCIAIFSTKRFFPGLSLILA